MIKDPIVMATNLNDDADTPPSTTLQELPPTSCFYSFVNKPCYYIPKQQPQHLVWWQLDFYWYASAIVDCPIEYIDNVIPKHHIHRVEVDNWIEQKKKMGQLIFVVQRKGHRPLESHEHYSPYTNRLKIEMNFQQFLYKRTCELHKFSQVKVRGQCSHCKARVYNQCQSAGCGKFSCIYHSECLQHHWWFVVNNYDYFIHQPIPFDGCIGTVSLVETKDNTPDTY